MKIKWKRNLDTSLLEIFFYIRLKQYVVSTQTNEKTKIEKERARERESKEIPFPFVLFPKPSREMTERIIVIQTLFI